MHRAYQRLLRVWHYIDSVIHIIMPTQFKKRRVYALEIAETFIAVLCNAYLCKPQTRCLMQYNVTKWNV